jgi:hypothetical protein
MYKIDLHSVDHYEIEGRVIKTTVGDRASRYVLPMGARISLSGNSRTKRGVIEIGGYTKLTVSVSGPLSDLEPLFRFLA